MIERSVFLGHTAYESLYRHGVAEACGHLGIEHREINLLTTMEQVEQEVADAKPDLIWGHMLFWAPHNSRGAIDPRVVQALCEKWKKAGIRVVLHDGDPRLRTRFPHSIRTGVDLVLANHMLGRAEWETPVMHWPFACPTYEEMAAPTPEFEGDIIFTGTLRAEADGGLYDERTACLLALRECGVLRVLPEPGQPNTMCRSAEVAASADAIIGFGRPEIPGWIDTRVFQVAGAGGVLLHDDVGSLLVPHEHYVPVERYDVESILEGMHEARREGPRLRKAAFEHMQAHHTWTHRVRKVLDWLEK